MRAEDTLQFMADFYPSIFPTRKSALEHLFCVPGNGYTWHNGELIPISDSRMSRYRLVSPVQKAIFQYPDSYQPPEIMVEYQLFGSTSHQGHWFFLRQGISPECLHFYHRPAILAFDWNSLIQETKDLIRADGIDPDIYPTTFIQTC